MQHHEWLSLLERDGSLPPTKALCSMCFVLHGKGMFLPTELEKTGFERRCLAFTGDFLICPHAGFDYEKLFDKAYHSRFLRGECSHCQKLGINTSSSMNQSTVRFPLLNIPMDGNSRREDISTALASLDFQVCPHRGLQDLCLPEIRQDKCLNRKSDRFLDNSGYWVGCDHHARGRGCNCGVCRRYNRRSIMKRCQCSFCMTSKKYGKCRICAATVHFQLFLSMSGTHTLWVEFRRFLFESSSSAVRWSVHVSQRREFENMKQQWYAITKHVQNINEELVQSRQRRQKRCELSELYAYQARPIPVVESPEKSCIMDEGMSGGGGEYLDPDEEDEDWQRMQQLD